MQTQTHIPVSVFYETCASNAPSVLDKQIDAQARQEMFAQQTCPGYCNIAQQETMLELRGDLSGQTNDTFNFRENIFAQVSGSFSRQRQLVCALSLGLFGHPSAALPGIADYLNQNDLRLYTAEAFRCVTETLTRLLAPDRFACSEYFGAEHRSGEFVNGVRHEDLERTSFDSNSFDVVLTSEVLEHVPDGLAAEREIIRMLKPNGIYCFTVPVDPSAEYDQILAFRDLNGQIHYYVPPLSHGDPIRPEEGTLVYRIFSVVGLQRRFESLGCEFAAYRLWSKELGILGANNIVFVIRKQ